MTVSEFVSEETKRRIGFMMKFTKMQAFGNDYVYIDAIILQSVLTEWF